MLFAQLAGLLPEAVAQGRLLENAPMARYTTFRVGGPAQVLLSAAGEDEIVRAMNAARSMGAQVTFIGNGSNLLVRDGGIRGLVVRVGAHMAGVQIMGCEVTAQAGISLAALSTAVAEASLTGLEFAAGIPGTLGGAAAMNAGAYGGEIAQVVRSVRALGEDLQPVILEQDALEYGYRRSTALERGLMITQVTLTLRAGEQEAIYARMRELAQRRREKQPLSLPSAGSTFKRPEGHFAAQLIDEAGLRGLRMGGAQVSEKHAGFIVNVEHASAADILRLMETVRERVWARFGVRLENEVRVLGQNTPDTKEESSSCDA